jgi:hypothetical protein
VILHRRAGAKIHHHGREHINLEGQFRALVHPRAAWALGVGEAVAVAVHLEDVDVVLVENGAPVRRSAPNTLVQSSNDRLLVTMVEPRS